jgi:Bacterial protein of unknown function (DUF922)
MIRPAFLLWPVLLLAVMVGAQIKKPRSTIVWSESRKLTWQDFQGTVPEIRHEDAKTASGIQWHCPPTELNPTVEAFFDRNGSWVIDTMKGNGRLLEHEQIHFDLAEVYARMLRQKLRTFKITCRNEETQIDKIGNNAVRDLLIEQDRYDEDTKHGLDEKAQTEWEKEVKAMLQLVRPHSSATLRSALEWIIDQYQVSTDKRRGIIREPNPSTIGKFYPIISLT